MCCPCIVLKGSEMDPLQSLAMGNATRPPWLNLAPQHNMGALAARKKHVVLTGAGVLQGPAARCETWKGAERDVSVGWPLPVVGIAKGNAGRLAGLCQQLRSCFWPPGSMQGWQGTAGQGDRHGAC